MSFNQFLKQTPMADFSSFNSQVVWIIGSVSLNATACVMLLGSSGAREGGLVLAGMLLSAWTGKSYLNYRGHQTQRTTSREWLQGQANLEEVRGRAAAAVRAAETGEHAAAYPEPAPPRIEAPRPPAGRVTRPSQPVPAADAHEWAEGDPHEGLG